MQRATDTLQDAQDFMQHALWQHALCSNSKQQIACNMQQATGSMQQPSRRKLEPTTNVQNATANR
jgi:hypothetical protein